MNEVYEKVKRCAEHIKSLCDFEPRVALILGSGLGGFADEIEKVFEIKYSDIPDFPTSTVKGHDGKFVMGYVGTTPIIAMKGRVHYYEGYSMTDVVLPLRTMFMLGAKTLFLTNASGGINKSFKQGSLMIINGQISSFVPSPLIGQNIDELGTRFPDMSNIYDKELQSLIKATANENDIPVESGVYVQLTGPNFETPNEIAFLRLIGADAVGMSTAVEAIAARHMNMKVCGISCISNAAVDFDSEPLSHAEVIETAAKASEKFKTLIGACLKKM